MPKTKPCLVSLEEARHQLGGISRTTFYRATLPELEAFALGYWGKSASRKLGRRHMIYLVVLEAFMATDKVWWFITPQVLFHLIKFVPLGPGGFMHPWL